MKEPATTLPNASDPPIQASYQAYITGYLGSLILTLIVYGLVYQYVHSAHESISHGMLRLLIAGFAVAQFLVQLVCFLHLGRESKPRWKVLVFGFMVMVAVIVVFGSLWIMSNLNYHMVPHDELHTHLHTEEGL